MSGRRTVEQIKRWFIGPCKLPLPFSNLLTFLQEGIVPGFWIHAKGIFESSPSPSLCYIWAHIWHTYYLLNLNNSFGVWGRHLSLDMRAEHSFLPGRGSGGQVNPIQHRVFFWQEPTRAPTLCWIWLIVNIKKLTLYDKWQVCLLLRRLKSHLKI